MIYLKILTLITLLLTSQSCVRKKISSQDFIAKCQDYKSQTRQYLALFNKINYKELKIRNKTKVPSVSKPEELSVVSKIADAIKNAPKDSKYIAVDLRSYQDVDLTNIIIAKESDFTLTPYLYTSKYSQGYFSLININENSITITPPEALKTFKPYKIYRPDLKDSEIIINVSDSETIFGNLKFASETKISIIAENIKNPFRLDLREASEMQSNLKKRWTMPLYDIKNSTIVNSKITTGRINVINNDNANISVKKFKNSIIACYSDVSNQIKIINN